MTRTDLRDKARPGFQPEPLLRLFDNPLLIAQARRQFRQRALYFTWGFALLIGGAICLITHVSNRFTGRAEGWLVARLILGWLIFINLYFRSATRLNGLAADERRSGLLEFHQATPTRPLTDAVGLLIGMNARAWVSGGVLSIFWLIAGFLEGRTLSELFFALFFIFFGALLIHSFCFTLGLWGRGGGRLRMGGLIFILPLFFFAEGLDQLGAHTLAHLTPFPALSVSELSPLSKLFAHYESLQFFGLSLSPRLFTLFVQGGALWICLWLACRSLSNPNQALSRRGALIAWAAILLTILGADLSRGNPSQLAAMDTFMSGFFGASAYLLLASISGAGLLLLLSPTPLMLQQSERRAERLGRDRPQLIDNGAPISGALWVVMGVSVVGFALYLQITPGAGGLSTLSQLPVWIALFSLLLPQALCASLSEWLHIRSDNYKLGLAFYLSLILFIPLILAAAMLQLGQPTLVEAVASLSPLYALTGAAAMLAQALTGIQRELLTPQYPALKLFSFQYQLFSMGVCALLALTLNRAARANRSSPSST